MDLKTCSFVITCSFVTCSFVITKFSALCYPPALTCHNYGRISPQKLSFLTFVLMSLTFSANGDLLPDLLGESVDGNVRSYWISKG